MKNKETVYARPQTIKVCISNCEARIRNLEVQIALPGIKRGLESYLEAELETEKSCLRRLKKALELSKAAV